MPNKPFNPIARKTRSGLTAALGIILETLALDRRRALVFGERLLAGSHSPRD